MADKPPEHFYTRVAATCLIDGTAYPLVSFIVTYALDQIPAATVRLALGREASGTGQVSSAHGLLSSVKPFTPIEIKVKLEANPKGRFFHNDGDSVARRDSGLKDGENQTVFTGFLFTPAQVKDRQGSSATLEFQALGYPAALGGSTQVAASLISTKLESGADVISLQLGEPAGNSATAYHNLAAMIQKTKQGDPRNPVYFILDVIFDGLLKMVSSYNKATVNSSAAAALKRMRYNTLGTPELGLDYGEVPKDLYEKALAKYYVEEMDGRWLRGDADLWALLQAFAEAMLFHVVPAINHDALAPVTFGLGGEPWRSFEPSDYWALSMTPEPFSRGFYSYVGKVGMILPNTYHGFYQERMPIGVSMGFAELKNLGVGTLDGQVAARMIAARVPEFMICPGPASWKSGLGGESTPDAVNPNTPIADQHHGADMTVFYGGNMGNGYAQTILENNVFAHRTCSVTGRFRLDIAPGSLVRVRTIGEKFVKQSETFFGHALGVTLRCGESSMSTNVEIGSVRTESEHELYTVPAHPLYNKRWVGAMLTD